MLNVLTHSVVNLVSKVTIYWLVAVFSGERPPDDYPVELLIHNVVESDPELTADFFDGIGEGRGEIIDAKYTAGILVVVVETKPTMDELFSDAEYSLN